MWVTIYHSTRRHIREDVDHHDQNFYISYQKQQILSEKKRKVPVENSTGKGQVSCKQATNRVGLLLKLITIYCDGSH